MWVLFFLIIKKQKAKTCISVLVLRALGLDHKGRLIAHYSSIFTMKPRNGFLSTEISISWLHCVNEGPGERVHLLPMIVRPHWRLRWLWIFKARFNNWGNQMFVRCFLWYYYVSLVLKGIHVKICCSKKWDMLCIRLCLALTYIFVTRE